MDGVVPVIVPGWGDLAPGGGPAAPLVLGLLFAVPATALAWRVWRVWR
jgi:hypothetical protein